MKCSLFLVVFSYMTKEELAKFLKERGASLVQAEMLEQGMLHDLEEVAARAKIVPGLAWLEEQLGEVRKKFVATIKWNEGKEKGIASKDIEGLF